MSLTYEAVSAQLQQITRIITQINETHLLCKTPTLDTLNKNLRIFINTYGDILEQNLESKFVIFKERAIQDIAKHLKESAQLYGMDWTDESISSLDDLDKRCKKFYKSLNVHINLPTSQSSKKTKLAPIFDPEETLDLSQITNDFTRSKLSQLKQLISLFEKTVLDHNKLKKEASIDFKNGSFTNVKLDQLQEKYKRKTNEAIAIISDTNKTIKLQSKLSIQYLNNMSLLQAHINDPTQQRGLSLQTNLLKLKQLNQEQKKIQDQIFAEQKRAFPASNATEIELVSLKQNALDEFKTKLENFINHIIDIDARHRGPEVKTITQYIIDVVEQLTTRLEQDKPPITALSNIKQLKGFLLYQLNNKKYSGPNEDIILNHFFSTITPNSNLRQQIEQIYAIIAQMDCYLIDKATQCFKAQKITDETKPRIDELKRTNTPLCQKLYLTITTIITELDSKKQKLSFNSDQNNPVNEALNILHDLRSQLETLAATHDIKLNQEKKSTSSLTKLTQTTTKILGTASNPTILTSIDDIELLSKKITGELEKQQQLKTKLNEIKSAIFAQNTDDLIARVDEEDAFKKAQIVNVLKEKINAIKATIEKLKSQNIIIDAIENNTLITNTADQAIAEILAKNSHIDQVQNAVDRKMTELNQIIMTIKDQIILKYQENDLLEKINALNSLLTKFQNQQSPSYLNCQKKIIDLQNQHDGYLTQITTLQRTTADDFCQRFKTINPMEIYQNIDAQITHCDTELKEGLKLEKESIDAETKRRTTSNAYKTSHTIMTGINQEFTRIVRKYFRNLKKEQREEVNKLLQEDPNLISKTGNEILNIDPRLRKLKAIYDGFNAINNNYSTTTVKPHMTQDDQNTADKTYGARLIQCVNTHLRNNRMESLSEGRRHKFIQFIRINILKPLQDMFTRKNPHVFFATAGATITEKELVQLGNKAYEKLSQETDSVTAQSFRTQ